MPGLQGPSGALAQARRWRLLLLLHAGDAQRTSVQVERKAQPSASLTFRWSLSV